MKEKELPLWHQEIIRKRLELYKANPEQVLDCETAIDEIEEILDKITANQSKGAVKGPNS